MDSIFIIGRLLVGGYFIWSGINHFKNLGGLTSYAKSKKIPMAKEGVLLTGVLLIAGGASVLTGVAVIIGLWLLVAFLIATAFSMHAFWKVPHSSLAERMSDEINFSKNLALAGALLIILAVVSVPM